MRVQIGFDTERVLAIEVVPPAYRYRQHEQRYQYYQAVLERLRALPDVAAASLVSTLPLRGESNVDDVHLENDDRPQSEWPIVNIRYIDRHYFDVLGLAPTQGRAFDEADFRFAGDAGAQDCPACASVPNVVLSQAAQLALHRGADLLSKKIVIGENSKEAVAIIGVVPDVRSTMDAQPSPVIYIPYSVVSPVRGAFVIRTRAGTQPQISALSSIAQSVDPSTPIVAAGQFEDVISDVTFARRYQVAIATAFGIVALLMTMLGIYGVVALSVAKRRRELSIRMAIGADRSTLLVRSVAAEMRPVALGILAGLAIAVAGGRLLQAWLFEVNSVDLVSLGVVAALVTAVGVMASSVPIYRAVSGVLASTLRTE